MAESGECDDSRMMVAAIRRDLKQIGALLAQRVADAVGGEDVDILLRYAHHVGARVAKAESLVRSDPHFRGLFQQACSVVCNIVLELRAMRAYRGFVSADQKDEAVIVMSVAIDSCFRTRPVDASTTM